MNNQPRINPEFKTLIPPLTADEYNQLEQNIITHGCRDPIVLWRGVIIDGHNRFEICTRHGIGFQTIKLRLPSKEAAKLWILENQLGRRNLTDAMRIELAAAKVKYMGLKTYIRKNIAQAAKLSERTVQRYMQIKVKGGPELLEKVMTGELSIGTAHRNCVEVITTTVGPLCDDPPDPLTPEEENFICARAIFSHIRQIENIYTFLIRHRVYYADMPKDAAVRLGLQYKKLLKFE